MITGLQSQIISGDFLHCFSFSSKMQCAIVDTCTCQEEKDWMAVSILAPPMALERGESGQVSEKKF